MVCLSVNEGDDKEMKRPYLDFVLRMKIIVANVDYVSVTRTSAFLWMPFDRNMHHRFRYSLQVFKKTCTWIYLHIPSSISNYLLAENRNQLLC